MDRRFLARSRYYILRRRCFLVAYVVATEIAPFSNVVLVSAVIILIMLGQSLVEMASARWQLEERYELLTACNCSFPLAARS